MRLASNIVQPLQWLIVENAAPHREDLSQQSIELDGKSYPCFVDGSALVFRVPQKFQRKTYRVAVKGRFVGSVTIKE